MGKPVMRNGSMRLTHDELVVRLKWAAEPLDGKTLTRLAFERAMSATRNRHAKTFMRCAIHDMWAAMRKEGWLDEYNGLVKVAMPKRGDDEE